MARLSKQKKSLNRQGRPYYPDAWFSWTLLAIVAFLAYANAWPNVLVFDDREFLAGAQFSELGVSDFLSFFSQPLWEAGGNQSNLYRPLLMLSFGVESRVFGQWYAGYHLVNVGLHVVACLLVFGFARQVFRTLGYDRERTVWLTLAASLVFAVHPVFSDAVNSVFNGSEIYATIGVVGGLWYLLLNHRENPTRAWLALSLVYLWALLYRESAAVLPALAVVILWMTSRESWQARIRQCLPALVLLVPLALYMGLRANALATPDELAVERVTTAAKSMLEFMPSAHASDESGSLAQNTGIASLDTYGLRFEVDRFAEAVKVWFDGLKLMVWPHPLSVLHGKSETPLWLALSVQLLLLSLALFGFYRGRSALIIGLLFFYLAILPASRLVGEGIFPPMLMERMLYLPSVGLIIFLVGGLDWIGAKVSLRTLLIAATLSIFLLTPVTWARNQDWSDELRLLEGDFAVNQANMQLLYALVRAQTQAGNTNRSINLCIQQSRLVRIHSRVGVECAKAYAGAGKRRNAEALYLQALGANPNVSRTHFHLARLYVEMNRRQDAREHFELAIEREKMPFLQEFMRAIMLMDMYPHDRKRLIQAREHLESALLLQPRAIQVREALQYLDGKL